MKIYQFAALLLPTDNEKEDGKQAELIVPVTTVVAANDNAATVLAGRAIPEAYLDRLDRVQVAVRPF